MSNPYVVPLSDHVGFAREVLVLLNTQRRYFEKRDVQDLRLAKQWEQRLRETAERIIKDAQPTLFAEGGDL